eukprot:GILK01003616.1.p1 GENE.GILK01003616.1~~GILK01003616.1.p1  ORF type:complete len:1542 (-),score=470.79 GILK01003616.1:177-4385(-)
MSVSLEKTPSPMHSDVNPSSTEGFHTPQSFDQSSSDKFFSPFNKSREDGFVKFPSLSDLVTMDPTRRDSAASSASNEITSHVPTLQQLLLNNSHESGSVSSSFQSAVPLQDGSPNVSQQNMKMMLDTSMSDSIVGSHCSDLSVRVPTPGPKAPGGRGLYLQQQQEEDEEDELDCGMVRPMHIASASPFSSPFAYSPSSAVSPAKQQQHNGSNGIQRLNSSLMMEEEITAKISSLSDLLSLDRSFQGDEDVMKQQQQVVGQSNGPAIDLMNQSFVMGGGFMSAQKSNHRDSGVSDLSMAQTEEGEVTKEIKSLDDLMNQDYSDGQSNGFYNGCATGPVQYPVYGGSYDDSTSVGEVTKEMTSLESLLQQDTECPLTRFNELVQQALVMRPACMVERVAQVFMDESPVNRLPPTPTPTTSTPLNRRRSSLGGSALRSARRSSIGLSMPPQSVTETVQVPATVTPSSRDVLSSIKDKLRRLSGTSVTSTVSHQGESVAESQTPVRESNRDSSSIDFGNITPMESRMSFGGVDMEITNSYGAIINKVFEQHQNESMDEPVIEAAAGAVDQVESLSAEPIGELTGSLMELTNEFGGEYKQRESSIGIRRESSIGLIERDDDSVMELTKTYGTVEETPVPVQQAAEEHEPSTNMSVVLSDDGMMDIDSPQAQEPVSTAPVVVSTASTPMTKVPVPSPRRSSRVSKRKSIGSNLTPAVGSSKKSKVQTPKEAEEDVESTAELLASQPEVQNSTQRTALPPSGSKKQKRNNAPSETERSDSESSSGRRVTRRMSLSTSKSVPNSAMTPIVSTVANPFTEVGSSLSANLFALGSVDRSRPSVRNAERKRKEEALRMEEQRRREEQERLEQEAVIRQREEEEARHAAEVAAEEERQKEMKRLEEEIAREQERLEAEAAIAKRKEQENKQKEQERRVQEEMEKQREAERVSKKTVPTVMSLPAFLDLVHVSFAGASTIVEPTLVQAPREDPSNLSMALTVQRFCASDAATDNLQWACEQLSKWNQHLCQIVDQLETQFNSVPLTICSEVQYSNQSELDQVRTTLGELRRICTLRAKSEWMNWKQKLEQGINNHLSGFLRSVQDDSEVLDQYLDRLKELNQSLESHKAVHQKSISEAEAKKTASQMERSKLIERLARLHQDIQEQNSVVEEYKQKVMEMESQKTELTEKVQSLLGMQQTMQKELERKQKAVEAKAASQLSVREMANELDILLGLNSWKPLKLSANELMIRFPGEHTLQIFTESTSRTVSSMKFKASSRISPLLSNVVRSLEADVTNMISKTVAFSDLSQLVHSIAFKTGRLDTLNKEMLTLSSKYSVSSNGDVTVFEFACLRTRCKFNVTVRLTVGYPSRSLNHTFESVIGQVRAEQVNQLFSKHVGFGRLTKIMSDLEALVQN